MDLTGPTSPASAAAYLAVIGALIALLSIPLWRGWVRRNVAYGARTSTSLASDENWQTVNRPAGREGLKAGAALLLVAGAVGLVVPAGLSPGAYEALVAVPMVIALVWIVRAVVAGEDQVPRQRVQRWPDGTAGRPRPDDTDRDPS